MAKLKDFHYAQIVHDTLCAKTNCMEKDGKICMCRYIVCIDDDVTSAIYASKISALHKKTYGYTPVILCVGGKGLMSRWTHNMSEGAYLAYCCHKMGIPQNGTKVLDKGKNTGDNIKAIAKQVGDSKGNVLFVVTKRLSLRLNLSMQKQAPDINARYFVIDETVFEACKWYNGKRLGGGEMMLHELASILNRCDAYSGTFQVPVPFEVSSEVREAADYLAKNYKLKLPKKNFRSVLQFIRLLIAIKRNKVRMHEELIQTIKFEKYRPL